MPAGNEPAPLEEFDRLTARSVHPAGRGRASGRARFATTATERQLALEAIEGGEFGLDVLYSDYEGGQRVVTRFGAQRQEDGTWTLAAGRHWQIDRQNPR